MWTSIYICRKKSWADFDPDDNMKVMMPEREMLAESLGVSPDTLPPINALDSLDKEDEIEIELDSG